MTTHIIEVARVTPATASDSVPHSLKIPLTFFDLPWLLFSPVKRVFFYRHTESTHEHFNSFILPKLKLSLSLVLRNYLPLAGRITWAQNEPKPSIVVSQNDAVSVTIAETGADFSLLSGYGQRPVSELYNLLPELPVSDDSATVLSLQITLFPNQGFSIGVVTHHAVLDGKTSSTFIKAWAHICKQLESNGISSSLPENLTPSYDRSLINGVIGVDEKMIEMLRSLKGDATNTTRSLTPFPPKKLGDDVVLATAVLSEEDIEKLKERVQSESSPTPSHLLHLSTFVVAYAYAWTCLVKARGGSEERSVSLLAVGDFRHRVDPPLPATYFGNCVFPAGSYDHEAAEMSRFVAAVEILSGLVKGLSSRKIETAAEAYAEAFSFEKGSTQFGTVAGSARLKVYESDFGWGRPAKVDIVSIDQAEAIGMAERRDQSGGVEIGMCLKKTEMDIVLSIFNNGLQN
ncbi:Phenolic glucoside malonyltransferase 2 [Raphanus sativus]|uniref:Phenolic glucoside malonyltransferase 2 n=1 Tax=Raphanus sativus TaxID=3726 RepID=A0A6J0NDS8_RAPSA|nr:phenolic glucoside malonyltransferase 2 [Raphanus sativus]KAJ4900875.1 Phenolic glucoside malonyltransferase 2 [Raphanus sativus]